MSNLHDNRNGSNWALIVAGVTNLTVTANMAGVQGYNAAAGGAPGNGIVTDSNGNSYGVILPGFGGPGATTVTFERAQGHITPLKKTPSIEK